METLTTVGTKPNRIHSAVQQLNPALFFVSRDLYNIMAKRRRGKLNGLTNIEALIKLLEKDSDTWIMEILYEKGHLKALLFLSTKQYKITRSFPDLLLFNCTYKTNRYRMPLLHFAGATLCNTYFSSAFAFLSEKAKKDYVWAVKAYNYLVRYDIKLPNMIISD